MENKSSPTTEMEQTKTPGSSTRKRVMIAGVGNMFMKDDGFGGAVIKKMLDKKFPEGVEEILVIYKVEVLRCRSYMLAGDHSEPILVWHNNADCQPCT